MDKRIFIIIIAVVVGVVLGVSILARSTSNPIMQQLLRQQEQVLGMQKQLLALGDIGVNEAVDSEDDKNVDMPTLLKRQKVLEQRLAIMEGQVKGLFFALNAMTNPRGGAGAGANLGQGQQGNPFQQAVQPPTEDLNKVYDIPEAQSYIQGKKDAPITIVEFVDFQCPFCARFHPVVDQVLKEYPNEVKAIIKNFPLSFHAQARPAAKAALAAGEQGKYWEMATSLLANASQLTEDKFKELAGSLGLDVEKFMKDYKEKDAKWEEIIQADMALGQKIDVRGTPTFYLRGKKTNARDLTAFKNEIELILEHK